MFDGMKATIDAAGRIVVPKALRRAGRLMPGTEMEVRLVGDHLELLPTTARVRLERRGDLTVVVPAGKQERLAAAEVQDLVDEVRGRRGR
jgi:AbrB family looped-hinge helix DNA binding protein